jgi:hypothetical protein
MSHALWLAKEGVFNAWPGAALSAALLLVSAIVARRASPEVSLAAWRNAALVMLSPIGLPIWASLTFGVEHNNARGFGWASSGLLALALGAVVAAILVLRQGRRYWWAFLPMALTVVIAAFLGLFIGGMAIADDWV